ncbi:glycosyltransferase [Kluyvera sichuanensis]
MFNFDIFNFNMFRLGLESAEGRLGFDRKVGQFQRKIILNKDNIPSISAVFRIKNAAVYLEASVMSISPICKEIIIVDNDSSDDSLSLCYKLQNILRGVCDLKIYSYKYKLAIAGEGYHDNLTEENSLARYYSFAFSKATSDYVMKADAHLLYTPSALEKIQKKIKEGRRVVIFRGVELYGMKLSFERYIFRNDSSFNFIDGRLYEELHFNYKISKWEQLRSTIMTPCFIHFKRIRYVTNLDNDNLVANIYK